MKKYCFKIYVRSEQGWYPNATARSYYASNIIWFGIKYKRLSIDGILKPCMRLVHLAHGKEM